MVGPVAELPSNGSVRDQVSMPIGPRDPLVTARVVAISIIAVISLWYVEPDNAPLVIAFLVVYAAGHPLLAMRWPTRSVFFFVQTLADIAAFALVVTIAPENYAMASLALVGVLGYFAGEAETRTYVVLVVVALATMATTGALLEPDDWVRATVLAAVVWSGLGFLGHRSRATRRATRTHLVHAIGEAGGLGHLTQVDGRVVEVIGDVTAVTGWPRDEWMRRDHREFMHPDDVDGFWVDSADLVDGMLLDRVARFRTGDGRWIWLRDISRVVVNAGRLFLYGFWIDVTAEYVDVERANQAAATDELTGLRNRRFLLSELDRRQEADGHHLVLIDLNRFKEVNDTLGHDAGDDLLCVIARRLADRLAPGDVLARLGGDEFAIVIDDADDADAVAAIVDDLAAEVARPVELSGLAVSTALSAGIVGAGPDRSSATMLRHADIAMYAAKRAGRTHLVFDEDMADDSDRLVTLGAGLETALGSGELSLFFQPIVDIESGLTVALEGLARWDHPLFGLMTPASFLDVALMSESSGRFTRVMVERAIEALVSLRGRGLAMPIGVNVPIRVLEDDGFAGWVSVACERSAVSPELLVFEIAEVDLHDSGAMPAAIERLVDIGATISIDDFGTANATFERLRWRGVEQLKLDRSVVEDAVAHERERSILRSVLRLADELGYTVVAEGVESAQQLELLRSLGCRLAQGYHFAPPEHFEVVLGRLETRSAS